MANQYKLPHNTTYKVLQSNYLSAEDGGGSICDNCGKFITTTVIIENKENKLFVVGADCAITLSGINKSDEENIKRTVKDCKKFYKELKQNSINKVILVENYYNIIRIIDKDKPFIHHTFIKIHKDNFSIRFNNRIITKDEILKDYPELKNNYYIQNNII